MRLNSQKMFENGQQKIRGAESSCIGHVDFEELISEISKKGKFQARLESADDLYGIKKYNVMGLTPNKVAQLYYSICHRVYRHPSSDHANEWVGYELKIFIWLLVCYSFAEISNSQPINKQYWEKYSRIFHNKNIELLEYQLKLIYCSQSQALKWEKDEDSFVIQIMRSNQNKPKWNEIAKELYFKSDRRYFRNPKQIRQRWLNHLDPEVCKQEWTAEEDHLIATAVLKIGRKWAQIAKMGRGLRTQHMIKNRYFTLLRTKTNLKPGVGDRHKVLHGAKLVLRQLITKDCDSFPTNRSQKNAQISGEAKKNEFEIDVQQQNQIDLNAQISLNMDDTVELEYYRWLTSLKGDKSMKKSMELICLNQFVKNPSQESAFAHTQQTHFID